MKVKLTFLIVLAVNVFCYAQKAELKQLCKGVEQLYENGKPIHISYSVTVTGTQAQPETGTMNIEIYRSGNMSRILMEKLQEVLKKDKQVLVVNHAQKTLFLQPESPSQSNDQLIMNDMSELIDSASTITKEVKDQVVTYTLRYSPNYIYTLVKFKFSQKNKSLLSIYTEFSPNYPEPYYSMQVDYKQWDTSWKPDESFPGINKYVTRQNGKYLVKDSWNHYKLYQPEFGKL